MRVLRHLFCTCLLLAGVLVLVRASATDLSHKEKIVSGKDIIGVDVCDDWGGVIYASHIDGDGAKAMLNIVGGAEAKLTSECASIDKLSVRCRDKIVWVAALNSSCADVQAFSSDKLEPLYHYTLPGFHAAAVGYQNGSLHEKFLLTGKCGDINVHANASYDHNETGVTVAVHASSCIVNDVSLGGSIVLPIFTSLDASNTSNFSSEIVVRPDGLIIFDSSGFVSGIFDGSYVVTTSKSSAAASLGVLSSSKITYASLSASNALNHSEKTSESNEYISHSNLVFEFWVIRGGKFTDTRSMEKDEEIECAAFDEDAKDIKAIRSLSSNNGLVFSVVDEDKLLKAYIVSSKDSKCHLYKTELKDYTPLEIVTHKSKFYVVVKEDDDVTLFLFSESKESSGDGKGSSGSKDESQYSVGMSVLAVVLELMIVAGFVVFLFKDLLLKNASVLPVSMPPPSGSPKTRRSSTERNESEDDDSNVLELEEFDIASRPSAKND